MGRRGLFGWLLIATLTSLTTHTAGLIMDSLQDTLDLLQSVTHVRQERLCFVQR